MSDFFAMGGYAAYVWPSYAVFAVLFAAHVISPKLTKRSVLKGVLTTKRRQELKKKDHSE